MWSIVREEVETAEKLTQKENLIRELERQLESAKEERSQISLKLSQLAQQKKELVDTHR
jgi:predicted RNase H-like nuclease (RuvC/YqgF family)